MPWGTKQCAEGVHEAPGQDSLGIGVLSGEELPKDWECSQADGFLPTRDAKGKLTFRERDYLGEARAWGVRFLLGIENQQTVNLTYPWWLMEMDCPGIGVDNSLLMKTILIYESTHHGNSKNWWMRRSDMESGQRRWRKPPQWI